MPFFINPVKNHREREKGVLVYPVYSRRSGGLSIGINLFPDKKQCPFDCPYCEVFPFTSEAVFSIDQLETDLRSVINEANEKNIPIKDICFSGNGEPSISPFFPEALKAAANICTELSPSAKIVLITNGAGLLNEKIFNLLAKAVSSVSLDIWLKLDAGTPKWYDKINRSSISYNVLTEKIKEFTACACVTIQTMLCAVDGNAPSTEEAKAWEQLMLSLAANGKIRKVQIYGKARPAPEDPKSEALPVSILEERSESLKRALAGSGLETEIEVYA